MVPNTEVTELLSFFRLGTSRHVLLYGEGQRSGFSCFLSEGRGSATEETSHVSRRSRRIDKVLSVILVRETIQYSALFQRRESSSNLLPIHHLLLFDFFLPLLTSLHHRRTFILRLILPSPTTRVSHV